jgi:pimeloyl-ACP methyl ester carboxylesterase
MASLQENEIELINGKKISCSIYLDAHDQKNDGDFTNILFLNSSFFNRLQWKKLISELTANIQSSKPIRYITYDYAEFSAKQHIPHTIEISDFLLELDALLKYFMIEKINLFGISIGAWIGLNYLIAYPNKIQTYCGYGNLAPFIPEYNEMRKERFDYIRNSVDFVNQTDEITITESNWDFYFDRFYLPTFFNSLHQITLNQKTIEIFKRILFPMVKGNNMAILADYYFYITNTMIEEAKELEGNLSKIPKIQPILLLNGLEDNIAYPEMTQAIHAHIPHSKMELFEKLGHGSLLLGKGLKPIISSYSHFLSQQHQLIE